MKRSNIQEEYYISFRYFLHFVFIDDKFNKEKVINNLKAGFIFGILSVLFGIYCIKYEIGFTILNFLFVIINITPIIFSELFQLNGINLKLLILISCFLYWCLLGGIITFIKFYFHTKTIVTWLFAYLIINITTFILFTDIKNQILYLIK